MNLDPHRLLDICKKLVIRPDLQPNQPKPGVTHCNQFVDEALHQYLGGSPIGKELHGLMANAIVDKLEKDVAWIPFEVEEYPKFSGLLEAGHPAIAGIIETGHGHVNIVIIGQPVSSGHWSLKDCVPQCANVGKENWVGKGLNFAFFEKPRIFIMK